MYSKNNEGKSVVAERFFRALKSKIYKYVAIKNMYIYKLDDIVNKYKNTNHSKVKKKPSNVKTNN